MISEKGTIPEPSESRKNRLQSLNRMARLLGEMELNRFHVQVFFFSFLLVSAAPSPDAAACVSSSAAESNGSVSAFW